jgi:hypothetical protein
MRVIPVVRLIIAAILLAIGVTLGVWLTILQLEMVDKLNKRMPPEKQFRNLWWGPIKRLRFLEEYEREFPDDPTKRRLWLFFGIMLASFLLLVLDLNLR